MYRGRVETRGGGAVIECTEEGWRHEGWSCDRVYRGRVETRGGGAVIECTEEGWRHEGVEL